MTQPVDVHGDWRKIYAIEDALLQHQRAIAKAKYTWRMATHPARRPTYEQLVMADGVFTIAYKAALRNYLNAIKEIEEGK